LAGGGIIGGAGTNLLAELGAVRYATEYGCDFEGEAKVIAIGMWVDDEGEVTDRFGPYLDWNRDQDGPWEEFKKKWDAEQEKREEQDAEDRS